MIPPFANPFFSIRCLVSCYPDAYLSHKSYCQPRHLFSPCRLFLYEFIILDLTSSVNQKFRPDNPGRKNLYSICYPNPSIFPVLHSIQILTGFQLLLAVFFIPHLVYLATLSSVSVSSTQGIPSLAASEKGCSSILFIYPFP